MRTRNVILAAALCACLLVAILLRRPRSAAPQPHAPTPPTQSPSQRAPGQPRAPGTNISAFSQNFIREVPNALERLTQLQRLGHVPDGADDKDWWVARRTTWWGKRLDPKEFWKGRTVWLDASALAAAHSHGRYLPPPPYEDPNLAWRSDKDEWTLPSSENWDMHFLYSDRESAFWDMFTKTRPKPPEYITAAQQNEADTVLGSRYHFEHHLDEGYPIRTTASDLDQEDRRMRARAQAAGFPTEALTDEALRWAYILEKRAEYEKDYVRGHLAGTMFSSNYLARLYVEPKFITEPLSDEQLKVANAWKITYLQRLRREKADESYINAYLKAWNLSPAEVFGQ